MILILKVIAALALIVVLLRRKIQLGYVMLIDSVFLGILFQLSISTMVNTAYKTITSWETIEFVLILVTIMVLEHAMRKKLYIEKLVNSLKVLVGDRRAVMAMIPALIGFLPSAGGAMFSAPMVGEITKDMDITQEQKSFANFWYRHIWEFVLPLYPSFLIAAQLSGVELSEFFAVSYPGTIMAVIAGIPFAMGGIGAGEAVKHEKTKAHFVRELLIGMGPVILIMALVLIFKISTLISVVVVTILLFLVNRYSLKELIELFKESLSIKVVVMVIGIMVFKNMLGAANIISQLPVVLAGYGIPTLLAVAIICASTGYLTGIISAAVVISFPIVIGMINPMDLRFMAFAFTCCVAGTMISPMHLCLTLTAEFFKANLGGVIKRIIVPQSAVLLFMLALYYLL